MTASGASAERARRLLALLPRLRTGTTRLDELARTVGSDVRDVASDLVTLSMCGIPPYTPDALVSVLVEGDEVVVWSEPPALGGAVRLSDEELQALSAALEVAGVDRDDPRFAALVDAAASEPDLESAVRARVLAAAPDDTYARLAAAVEARRLVFIDYFSASSEHASCRAVEPHALANRRGVWYLTAYCRTARETRVFRVDRISRLELADETFDPPEGEGPLDPTPFDRDAFPTARVRFSKEDGPPDPREWPGAAFETQSDGSVLADIPYGSARWLARRVVARLGRAEVLDPPDVKEKTRELANTLLGEY